MDDLLGEFLTETSESMQQLDLDLVKLEQNPNDPELLGNIFRLVHTIKGTCGFLGLPRLESVAHAGENVLGKIRDGELEVTADAISLVLEALDKIKELLAMLEENEVEPEGEDTDLIDRLNALASGEAAPMEEAPAEEPAAAEGAAATSALGSLYEQLGGEDAINAAVDLFYKKVLASELLKDFFKSVNLDVLHAKQAAFLTKVLGGPDNYDGKDLATVHAPLVAAGLSDKHFDAVATCLHETLVELGAWGPTVEEVMAIVEGTRDDVLGRSEAGKAALAATVPAPVEAPTAKEVEKKPAATEVIAKESAVAASSIRVSVDLLENLMTMISELVLTRNQLMQILRTQSENEFAVPLQRLNLITSELQEGVMKTRMQPIGNAWAKLPRIVRDLSHEMNRKIDLEMLGADTELDRQVLELIKDPLTHMVRNSVDHGIEDPDVRKAAGKPETGKITLNAFHEGGHIIIEIKDDGAGLPVDKIKAKILEKGMATEAELEGMKEQQIQSFIMRPGFSTATKVTSVSGRGVGMDVVKNNIEKIGGTIELKSKEGKGTDFTIKIPLTLAIVSALIVECAGERFAIPQISVLELVRTSSESEQLIESINETPVLRLRNRLLPLVSLRDLLHLDGDGGIRETTRIQEAAKRTAEARKEAEEKREAETKQDIGALKEAKAAAADKAAEAAAAKEAAEAVQALEAAKAQKPVHEAAAGKEPEAGKDLVDEQFIVVSQVGTYTFGIIVDRVFDTEEIVVKPVAPILRDISMFSGNTILGDGSVIMILDPNGIAASTGETTVSEEHLDAAAAASSETSAESVSLLIFRAGDSSPKAVPLALVARLEEIELEKVEVTHGKPMVQYRGHLMPLVCIDDEYRMKTEGRQPILVFSDRDRTMGLVVDEIVDIVEEVAKVELAADLPGILGSAIIANKATDMLDVGHYLTKAFHDWFGTDKASAYAGEGGKRILLVDDSPFFRNLLTPLLSVAGYEVTTAEGAKNALEMCEQGQDFDLIISDIEMPEMDGFEFAEAVRKGSRWQEVPMVALSSYTSQEDIDRGREVGFNDYVPKTDRDGLLATLAETIGISRGA